MLINTETCWAGWNVWSWISVAEASVTEWLRHCLPTPRWVICAFLPWEELIAWLMRDCLVFSRLQQNWKNWDYHSVQEFKALPLRCFHLLPQTSGLDPIFKFSKIQPWIFNRQNVWLWFIISSPSECLRARCLPLTNLKFYLLHPFVSASMLCFCFVSKAICVEASFWLPILWSVFDYKWIGWKYLDYKQYSWVLDALNMCMHLDTNAGRLVNIGWWSRLLCLFSTIKNTGLHM